MTDRPCKILVVDDEPDLEPLVLQRMRRNIRRGQYAFVFAHNGVEALEWLNEDGEIDMVLSDINMSTRTLLKGAAIGRGDPGAVLTEVNDLLNESNEAAMFVTLLYGVYDAANMQFTYANGGHNSPLVVHADGSSTELPLTGGVALGVMPELPYKQETVTIAQGDTVVLFTDGVTEAMNEAGEEFGVDRLREVFAASPPQDSAQTSRSVFEAVHAFADDTPQSDDVTCLVFRPGEAVP